MGQQCRHCKKINHFSKLCLSREVHQLQEVAVSDQETEEDSDQEESEVARCLFTQLSQAVFQKTSNFMKLLRWKILKFASSWIVVQRLMLCH